MRLWRIWNRAGARSAGWSPWALQRPGSRVASWYRIENAAGRGSNAASVYIYDEIGFWGVTAQDFVADFKAIRADSINVHINSPGGEVYDGLAIYNLIKNHPAEVTVHIDGLAASAASFIAMAGDRVVIARNADMMIHDGMGVCMGNAADMRSLADRLDSCSDNIADIYAQRTGQSVTHWRDQMRANDGEGTWYTGQEAVAAGLADEVAGDVSNEDAERASNWMNRLSIFASNRPAPTTEAPAGATGDRPGPGAPDASAGDTTPVAADRPALAEPDPEPENVPWASLGDALRAAVTPPAPEPARVPDHAALDLGDIFKISIQSLMAQDAPAPDSPPVATPKKPSKPDGSLLADALREGINR